MTRAALYRNILCRTSDKPQNETEEMFARFLATNIDPRWREEIPSNKLKNLTRKLLNEAHGLLALFERGEASLQK